MVTISSDADNFIFMLQFSRKGQPSWTNGKLAMLNRFRLITDEMVEKADLNVAFSLFDTNGQLLGGASASAVPVSQHAMQREHHPVHTP